MIQLTTQQREDTARGLGHVRLEGNWMYVPPDYTPTPYTPPVDTDTRFYPELIRGITDAGGYITIDSDQVGVSLRDDPGWWTFPHSGDDLQAALCLAFLETRK
jgi:hypothetical protein